MGMVGGKLVVAADGLGLNGLRSVDGSVQFGAVEGHGDEPSEEDEEGEGDEGLHVGRIRGSGSR